MEGADSISPDELAERLASSHPPRLLDVREPNEHDYVTLPGSKLIPLGQLMDRHQEIEAWREHEVVVFCHHGIRSQQGIRILHSVGFRNLLNLAGGIDRYATDVDSTLNRY